MSNQGEVIQSVTTNGKHYRIYLKSGKTLTFEAAWHLDGKKLSNSVKMIEGEE